MESSSQLEQLAADLYGSAQHIKAFCGQESYPNKSLDSIQPATLLPADAPDSIKIEKQNVRDTATRILQLTCDPTDFVGAFQVEVRTLPFIALLWLTLSVPTTRQYSLAVPLQNHLSRSSY
jgi:hypothetical protein